MAVSRARTTVSTSLPSMSAVVRMGTHHHRQPVATQPEQVQAVRLVALDGHGNERHQCDQHDKRDNAPWCDGWVSCARTSVTYRQRPAAGSPTPR